MHCGAPLCTKARLSEDIASEMCLLMVGGVAQGEPYLSSERRKTCSILYFVTNTLTNYFASAY